MTHNPTHVTRWVCDVGRDIGGINFELTPHRALGRALCGASKSNTKLRSNENVFVICVSTFERSLDLLILLVFPMVLQNFPYKWPTSIAQPA